MLTYSCFWNFHCTLKYFRRNIFSSGAWYISEIQTTKNLICALAKNFFFNFRIYQIFSYFFSSADFCSTKFMFAFAFFFQAKHFHCSSRLKASFQHASFQLLLNFAHMRIFQLIRIAISIAMWTASKHNTERFR